MLKTHDKRLAARTYEESKTSNASDHSSALIPYVLRLSTDQTARNVLQPESSANPSSSSSSVTSSEETNPIVGRVQILNLEDNAAENPPTVDTLLSSMFSSELLTAEMEENLSEWENSFAEHSEDLESQVDLLAILVLQIIRPTLLSYPRGSIQQSAVLDFEKIVEQILNQMILEFEFNEFTDECEERLLKARIAKALAALADQTLATQSEVFNALLSDMNGEITHVFLTLQESLIALQSARAHRILEQNRQVVEMTQRAHQVGEQLRTETRAIAEIAHHMYEHDQNYQTTLSHCRIIVSRCQ